MSMCLASLDWTKMTPNVIEPLKNLLVEVSTLNFDQANARLHNQRNLDAIKQSLISFGQHNPIVVQKQGMIVRIGNGRLQAAKALGWTHIAAVIVDESNVDAIARGIADNKTAELATWDFQILSQLMSGLQEDGVDLSVTGFADYEIEPFMMADWEPEDTEKSLQDFGDIKENIEKNKVEPELEPETEFKLLKFTIEDWTKLQKFFENKSEDEIPSLLMEVVLKGEA